MRDTAVNNLIQKLWSDETGFLLATELVLISTILVIGMVVGLAEVQHAVVQELEDVASAFGSVNQTYRYSGMDSPKSSGRGSGFGDHRDACDSQWDIVCASGNGRG